MCGGFLWYNYLVALNSFRLCVCSTSSSTKALQWINELLVTSGTFPLKSSLASSELIPLQASSWEKVRKWMSSRDVAELPQEHIFTLVLFFRDQTWGNAELLRSSSHWAHQPDRQFPIVWLLVMCCALLSLPSLALLQGRCWQHSPLSKQVASPSYVSFRFLPNYFCCFFNCQRLLLFPLILFFIFEIIYSLPYIPNLAFVQCVFLVSFPSVVSHWETQQAISPARHLWGAICCPFFVLIREISEDEMLIVLLWF